MNTLRISLFGAVRIAHGDGSSPVVANRTTQAILAYLVLQRNRHHWREELAGVFWPEYEECRARKCLNTALWRLRRVLEPDGVARGTYLMTDSLGEVAFNCDSDHQLDIAEFEDVTGLVLSRPVEAMNECAADSLERGMRLYSGQLLEAFYDDWILGERDRLQCLFLRSLAYLMRYYCRIGDIDRSISCGTRILRLDPLCEEVHREMIRILIGSGQRAKAVQQYRICCEVLANELGVSPSEETRALYAKLVPQAVPDRRGSDSERAEHRRPQPACAEAIMEKLLDARRRLEEGELLLRQAFELFEREKLAHAEWPDRVRSVPHTTRSRGCQSQVTRAYPGS